MATTDTKVPTARDWLDTGESNKKERLPLVEAYQKPMSERTTEEDAEVERYRKKRPE